MAMEVEILDAEPMLIEPVDPVPEAEPAQRRERAEPTKPSADFQGLPEDTAPKEQSLQDFFSDFRENRHNPPPLDLGGVFVDRIV